MGNKIFILITVITVAVFGALQFTKNNRLKKSNVFGAIYFCESDKTFARSGVNISPATIFTLTVAVTEVIIAITAEATADITLLATTAATIGIVDKQQDSINRNINIAMAALD